MRRRPLQSQVAAQQSRAFTVVEVLIALTLSAVLMLALLNISTSMARTQVLLENQQVKTDPLISVSRLFRYDLIHAQQFKQGDNFLELQGTGSIDRITGKASHLPAAVTYELRDTGGTSCLIRRQTETTKLTNKRDWTEIVAAGVESFSCKPIGTSQSNVGSSGKFPRQVRITVRWTDTKRAPFVQDLFTR